MKITTEMFGEIEIQTEDVVSFPDGLLAFESEKEFVLLDLPENPVFKWLQSIKEPSLGFLLTSPFSFYPDYEFDLTERDQKELQIEKIDEVAVFAIVTINRADLAKMTVNLLGPIVFNTRTRIAKQVVLPGTTYSTKELLVKVNQGERDSGTVKEACK